MCDLKTVELFGGLGAPRKALINLGVDVKSLDYVENDPKSVNSYNEMFKRFYLYKPQDVRGWNMLPDMLIHGSPCQDFSIAGQQKGADEGSQTRSSFMWETINIIKQMGQWKPQVVVWENVKNLLSRYMRHNFDKYINELDKMGYTSSYEVLNATQFGLPQCRERVFTVSCLNGVKFDFGKLKTRPMHNISEYLEDDVPEYYTVTQPSLLSAIGKKGVIKRMTVIEDCAYTLTERPDRCPGQVIELGNGKYRFLTEREYWRLQGFEDKDFDAAARVNSRRTLYKQAGNSIAITVLEALFTQILEQTQLGEKIYA